MKCTRVLVLTVFAMTAFAANSLLCRLALKRTAIDAATFTSIRIMAGALVLWPLMRIRGTTLRNCGSWYSALALFGYAATFSLAYLSLSAGTGALLLFAAVQATMICWGFHKGERLSVWQSFGLVLAFVGLLWLLLPGVTAPSLVGALLMLAAGVAWGVYSVRGKNNADPADATAGNFLRAVPITVIFSLASLGWNSLDRLGLIYATISGAVTSGLGYVIWYAALPGLKATSAGAVQLSVPVLAAIGGILFLGEAVTLRLAISSVAILGGIALVVLEKTANTAVVNEN